MTASEDRTFRDLVREVNPSTTDEEADYILWERTPFPMLTLATDLLPYIERFFAEQHR